MADIWKYADFFSGLVLTMAWNQCLHPIAVVQEQVI